MILHILGSGSMFTKDTYSMISEYFNTPEEEHCFVGKFPNCYNYTVDNGCKVIKSKSFEMILALYKADTIIVHGLINKLVVILLTFQPWLLKKCNWIIWGGDIYIHEKKNKTFSEKVIEKFKRFIAPKFPYISTLAKGDYSLAKEWYGITGKQFPIAYPVPASNKELLNELSDSTAENKKTSINIIVGNSATETNQHFQALDWLSHFKDENIQIYLPLSYGTGDFSGYADKVENYAIKIFGEKVHTLREQMPGEEYLRFLNNMDVGIFNNNRQQAMGNISQLVLCGAKVYLRTDTKMWLHFKDLGCNLNDIESIKDLKDIKELARQNPVEKEKNMSIIGARHDINLKVKLWREMLEAISSK